LLVLPELFTTGYYFERKEDLLPLSENIPDGDTVRFLSKIAKKKNINIVGGIAEKDGSKIFNSAVVIGPNGFIGKHRKVHLPRLEKSIFSCGDRFEVFQVGQAKIGIIQCFDSWFPEAARLLARKGANILINPANFGGPRSIDVMKIRPLENKVYGIIANRTGSEVILGEKENFRGESMLVNFNGDILVQAGRDEELIEYEINPELTNDKSTIICDNIWAEVDKYK